jgi:nucleotide-binding universal stress UspA family protein
MEVARHVVVGIPYRKIVDVAEEEKIDLIVMTTHGRTGLSHLGWVASPKKSSAAPFRHTQHGS